MCCSETSSSPRTGTCASIQAWWRKPDKDNPNIVNICTTGTSRKKCVWSACWGRGRAGWKNSLTLPSNAMTHEKGTGSDEKHEKTKKNL